jgi:hypothetical protein
LYLGNILKRTKNILYVPVYLKKCAMVWEGLSISRASDVLKWLHKTYYQTLQQVVSV